MGPLVDDHILSWIVFLPLGTAVALLLTGFLTSALFGSRGLPDVLWRALAISSSSITFILAAAGLWVRFDPERTGYQAVERLPWLPEYGIHYFVGVDGISMLLVLLTTLLVPVVLLATWKEVETSQRSFVVLFLALETCLLGSLVSLNVFQFYLFWEATLVPVYFIVGIWGGPRRVDAALKFYVFGMLGSLLMLVAILVLYRLNFEQFGSFNFDLVALPGHPATALLDTRVPVAGEDVPWWSSQTWLFAAFALAFAIKVPVFPLHTWLADLHVEAPTSASALLSGVLLKLGIYGLLRFALPLFPDAASGASVLALAFGLGLVGVLYGALITGVQSDIKRFVALSSLAHMGLAVLGVFTLTVHGLTGAVVLLLTHGLATAGLFLLVGFLYERRQTTEVSEFGGVAKPMPVFAAMLGLLVMCAIGLPALGGFVGGFLVLLGTFAVRPAVGAGALVGVVLLTAFAMRLYRSVMLGPVERPENRGLIDLGWRERAAVLALLAPIFWIGLYPNTLLRRIEPSVMELLRVMDERSLAPVEERSWVVITPEEPEQVE